MPQPKLLQTNFSKGEASDLIGARSDLAAYFNCCSILENFFIYPEGGAKRRGGLRHIAEVKDSANKTMLIPFEFSATEAFMLELGNLYWRIFKNSAPIIADATTLITNGTFFSDLSGWTAVSTVWSAGVAHFNILGASLRQSFTTVAGKHYHITVTGINGVLNTNVGTTDGGSQLLSFQTVAGANSGFFIATTTTTFLTFTNASLVAQIDDVVVKIYEPLEVTTVYTTASLPDIQYRQYADVLFTVHAAFEPQRLNRISDTNWTAGEFNARPPPSIEEEIALGTDLGLFSNTGLGIQFHAATSVFLAGDVGRAVEAGSGRAIITAISGKDLTVDVIDDFAQIITAAGATVSTVGTAASFSAPHSLPVGIFIGLTSGTEAGQIRRVDAVVDTTNVTLDAAFSADQTTTNYKSVSPLTDWVLTNSPLSDLVISAPGPPGAIIPLVANIDTFRLGDIGKFVKLLGGLVQIAGFVSAQNVAVEILSTMTRAEHVIVTGGPDFYRPALAGSWTMEVSSWSDALGWPSCIEFHAGRLAFAGTINQPNTFWLSSATDIKNFAVGSLADNAMEYTVLSRRIDPIQWLLSLDGKLFIGDLDAEHTAKGKGVDAPIGGDEIPYVRDQSAIGSIHTQPIIAFDSILLQNRFKNKIYELAYDINTDNFSPKNRTLLSREIGEGVFAQHPAAYAQEPNSIIYYGLENGQLAALTYNKIEDVIAWSRIVTDGEIESWAVIPDSDGTRHQIWVIVKRTINGSTKRFIEIFDDDLHTDCATTGTIVADATTITGLDYLEGETGDLKIDGDYKGPFTVTGGAITGFPAPTQDGTYEFGLHYDSTLRTMRAAVPNQITEGLIRHWVTVWLRLKETIGGKINGRPIEPQPTRPYTGLVRAGPFDTDYDGFLTITQDQPYPFTILSIVGEVEFADEL